MFLQTTSIWQIARRKIQERLRAVYLLGLAWILLAVGANVVNILYRVRESQIECSRENSLVITFLVLGEYFCALNNIAVLKSNFLCVRLKYPNAQEAAWLF